MKKFLIILVLFFVGCATPHNIDTELARIEQVSVADIASHAVVLEEHYWKYSQREGVIFPPTRSDPALELPDRYSNGGDSALYTGYMLAASVYKYKVTKSEVDLFSVMRSLRGLYILTHATGTPGVISRAAFPATLPELWSYPEHWQSRIARGFVSTGPEHKPTVGDWTDFLRSYPAMTYYTRATRDQLTGVLFGLIVAWNELTDLDNEKIVAMRTVIKEISNDLYAHLRVNDFMIVDEKGENDTNADDVTGFLKLQLLALYRKTASKERQARIQEKYEDQAGWSLSFSGLEFWNVFNNYNQYYAWNLRYARAYSAWLLEDDSNRKQKIADYIEKGLWSYTKDHNCPFFAYMYLSATGKEAPKRVDDAVFALKSLTLRPIRQYDSPLCGDMRMPNIFQVIFGLDAQYHLPPHLKKPTNYFTWTKRGWDVREHCSTTEPYSDASGLDFLLPYWMGRYLNLVPAK
jgi:hypothetical protein